MKAALNIVDTPEDAARLVAEHIATRLRKQPVSRVMLAGGNTPRMAYEQLASYERGLFAQVWFALSDERMVPIEHADSNLRMIRKAWLDAHQLVDRVMVSAGETDAAIAAKQCESLFCAAGAPPFAIALLGLGTDGHTASLFPGDGALASEDWFTPARGGARMTATFRMLRQAEETIFLVVGDDKAAILRNVLEDAQTVISARLPAAQVMSDAQHAIVIADRAAARLL